MAENNNKHESSSSAGAVANADGGEFKFTPGESKFFATIFKYLPKTMEIDWEAFAAEMGLKDGQIAKVCFYFSLKPSFIYTLLPQFSLLNSLSSTLFHLLSPLSSHPATLLPQLSSLNYLYFNLASNPL
jgi:hypothetical protein